MKKYWILFRISIENDLTYRFNFVLGRLRNILRFILVYFLWQGVFLRHDTVLGFSKNEMIGYVFLVLLVQSVILASPSADSVGGEIGGGTLGNYLVKPVSYLRYWFVRDLANKLLHLLFGIVEMGVLLLLLGVEIEIRLTAGSIWAAIVFVSVGIVMFFWLNMITKLVSFWAPEDTWGITFLLLVMVEILSGAIFPLDVLGENLGEIVKLLPFSYLAYLPISVGMGHISNWELFYRLGVGVAWCGIGLAAVNWTWDKGLKVYGAEGK